MLRMLIIQLLLITSVSVGGMADTKGLFSEANMLYNKQDYTGAASKYEELINTYRIHDPSVFYNLANSYFKQQKFGHAILNYEKALLITPRDRDIKDNLSVARSRIVDKVDVAPSFSSAILQFLISFFSMNEVSVVLLTISLLFFSVTLMIINFRISYRWKTVYYYLMLPVFLVMSIWFAVKYVTYEELQSGVVLGEKVDVKSGPGDSFQTLFVVHEGLKVGISAHSQGWTRITLENGYNGWIPGPLCGKINPL